MKKKVIILGATGMLGSAVYGVLKDKYDVVLAVRDPQKISLLEAAYGGTAQHTVKEFDASKLYDAFLRKEGPAAYLNAFAQDLGDVAYVINAIGVTIPYSLEDQAKTFFINGALPHVLAGFWKEKLIHVTTDCVYNGKEGFPYDENSALTPVDIYGLSKSIGEPTSCLTIRTSIVGRELEGFTGLLEWFLQQNGKTVKGFTNHFWNGITTKQFGKVCDAIMSNPEGFSKSGLYHVFTNPVSKYDMLLAFKERFAIDCEIVAEGDNRLNRTLATVRPLNAALKIPEFAAMIKDL